MAETTEQLSAGSAEVAHNLAEADHQSARIEHPAGGEHAELALFGVLTPGTIVSLAMTVFIIVLLVKKVPALIGSSLDKKIAGIKAQLDEATKLRKEAEALRAEYDTKLKAVAGEAEMLRHHAEEEAAQIVADAKVQAADLVKRRQKMAEEKIAAAERSAIADIRTKTVQAATQAAAVLIAEGHSAAADKALVDSAIKGLGPVA